MIRAVFARELRGSLGALAVVSASLACCAVAIASMFSPETARMLEDLKAAMPELYDAFGMSNDTSTLTGFLLNYLYGFLFTLGPLALTLLAVSRSAVRPAATGELANVLASPHSKSSVAASIAAAVIASVLEATAISGLAAVIAAEALFPGVLDLAAMARVNLGLLAFQLFMAGICLLSALALRRPSAALWAGGGLCLAEYLVQMVAQISGTESWGASSRSSRSSTPTRSPRATRAPSGQRCASRSSGRRSPRGRSRRSPDATSAYKAASHGPGANR